MKVFKVTYSKLLHSKVVTSKGKNTAFKIVVVYSLGTTKISSGQPKGLHQKVTILSHILLFVVVVVVVIMRLFSPSAVNLQVLFEAILIL